MPPAAEELGYGNTGGFILDEPHGGMTYSVGVKVNTSSWARTSAA
jgi:hypothetical protein